jgi:glutathione S-transferase
VPNSSRRPAASVEYPNFNPIASGIAFEKIFKRYQGGVTDEKRVEDLLGQFEGKLDGYEAILGKQKYLAGDVRASSCSKRAPLNRRH